MWKPVAWRPFAAAIALAVALLSSPARAGQTCEEHAPSADSAAVAMQAADKTLEMLDGLDDEVVLIARVGQDLSKYGLRYSHMGFAVRSGESWSVIHKLNQCGTGQASIFDQGLLEFFSDSPFRYEAGVWRLEPSVQARLKKALSGKKSLDYHEPKYSMLAYPFSTKYQNSNGWVLEVLAYGLAPEDEANTRQTAQAWLKQSGYMPTTLELGTLTRLGARVTRANVFFDDHPGEQRWAGRIATVTVESMLSLLRSLPNGCQEKGCPAHEMRLSEPAAR